MANADRAIIVCPLSLAVEVSKRSDYETTDLVVVNDCDFEATVTALAAAVPPGKRLTIYRWNDKEKPHP